jgi:thymidylate synthase
VKTQRARNVNGMFYEGMHLLDEDGAREDSRAGPVVVAPWPVMSVYERPTERVLFDPRRDANPFFHLMEGLWMLSGRNDASFLNRYVSNFGQRFAESASGRSGAEADGVIHDAYGHRWRSALGHDQLDAIVARLRANPQDRQCVLQMWNADERGQQWDLTGDWKTRPCNTHAYFRVRLVPSPAPLRSMDRVLDMTICCRSNDAVWGAHGANAVHFSMLQEYVAGRVGVGVGTLYQLSNNYHAYVDALAKIGPPEELCDADPYEGAVSAMPMATDWNTWDEDLADFMSWHDDLWTNGERAARLIEKRTNEWFYWTPVLVSLARWQWTNAQKHSAMRTAEQISATDWRRACVEWMQRRMK